jgi:hypothetical protein
MDVADVFATGVRHPAIAVYGHAVPAAMVTAHLDSVQRISELPSLDAKRIANL